MPIESAADRLAFADPAEFGVGVTYTPKGYPHPSSKSRTVYGIFDNDYVDVAEIESRRPVLHSIATASITDATHGAMLRIDSVDYNVVGIEPDGTGMTMLILEKCL